MKSSLELTVQYIYVCMYTYSDITLIFLVFLLRENKQLRSCLIFVSTVFGEQAETYKKNEYNI